jgi:hypothetical protein
MPPLHELMLANATDILLGRHVSARAETTCDDCAGPCDLRSELLPRCFGQQPQRTYSDRIPVARANCQKRKPARSTGGKANNF